MQFAFRFTATRSIYNGTFLKPPPPKKKKSATAVSKVGWSKEKVLLKEGWSFIMCLLHCITNHIPFSLLLPAPEITSTVDQA